MYSQSTVKTCTNILTSAPAACPAAAAAAVGDQRQMCCEVCRHVLFLLQQLAQMLLHL
jgi:hypothetical protein